MLILDWNEIKAAYPKTYEEVIDGAVLRAPTDILYAFAHYGIRAGVYPNTVDRWSWRMEIFGNEFLTGGTYEHRHTAEYEMIHRALEILEEDIITNPEEYDTKKGNHE